MKFRLLPVFIFFTAFTLSIKLGGLWVGFHGLLTPQTAIAREKPATADAGKKASGDSHQAAKKAGASTQAAAADTSTAPSQSHFDPSVVTDSELDVLQKLAERRAELDRRARQLDTREKLLRATENRIEAKITDLKKIQETISKLLVKHDEEKEKKMRSLVKIYEKMKPKDAARIFDELEMPILLDVLERMREAKSAQILANMSSGKAKAVTAALAQRRALPKLAKDGIQ